MSRTHRLAHRSFRPLPGPFGADAEPAARAPLAGPALGSFQGTRIAPPGTSEQEDKSARMLRPTIATVGERER